MWHSTSSYGIRRRRCPMKTGTYWDMPTYAKQLTIRWWRAFHYEWVTQGTMGEDSFIRPIRMSTIKEYDLSAGGREWESVPKLVAALGLKSPVFGLSKAHERVVLEWCRRHGLPALLSLNAVEIALPRTKRRKKESEEEWDHQEVYLRTGGCWSPLPRTWHEAIELSGGDIFTDQTAPAWAAEGQVRLSQGRPASGLDYAYEHFPGRQTLPLPLPLTVTFWRHYAERLGQLAQALVDFSDAVRLFAQGRPDKMYCYTDAATLRVRPASTAKRPAQPAWEVASLLSAFALQVVFGASGERFATCANAGCEKPIFTHHSRRKWCSNRCREVGRKRIQRAREKARRTRTRGTGHRRNR